MVDHVLDPDLTRLARYVAETREAQRDDAFEKILIDFENDGDFQFRLGSALYQIGYDAYALNCYKSAFQKDPDLFEAAVGIIDIAVEAGDFSTARKYLLAVFKPAYDPVIYRSAARFYSFYGDKSKEESLRRRIYSEEKTDAAFQELAEFLIKADDIEGVLALCANDSRPATHAYQGIAFYQNGKNEEALAALQRVPVNHLPTPLYYYLKLMALRDAEKAYQESCRAQEKFPDEPYLKQIHCELLMRLNRFTEAAAVANQLLEFNPGSAAFSLTAAQAAILGDSIAEAAQRILLFRENAKGYFILTCYDLREKEVNIPIAMKLHLSLLNYAQRIMSLIKIRTQRDFTAREMHLVNVYSRLIDRPDSPAPFFRDIVFRQVETAARDNADIVVSPALVRINILTMHPVFRVAMVALFIAGLIFLLLRG